MRKKKSGLDWLLEGNFFICQILFLVALIYLIALEVFSRGMNSYLFASLTLSVCCSWICLCQSRKLARIFFQKRQSEEIMDFLEVHNAYYGLLWQLIYYTVFLGLSCSLLIFSTKYVVILYLIFIIVSMISIIKVFWEMKILNPKKNNFCDEEASGAEGFGILFFVNPQKKSLREIEIIYKIDENEDLL